MSAPSSVFVHTGGQRAALEQVALAVTAAPVDEHGEEVLVLALWPAGEQRKVISSPGNSTIRAAISVAVAAGNTRAWAGVDAGDGTIADLPVAALPEIIRASVEPSGIRSVQVAAIRRGDDVDCYSMWLSPSHALPDESRARHAALIGQLGAATDADRARADEAAREAAAAAAARAAAAGDRDVPTRSGAVTSAADLPDRNQFERTLAALECDEAAVLVLGIDNADQLTGDDAEAARDTVASRLVASVRKHDVIAYVGPDTFGVLLVNVDRHTAFDISRRLRATLAEPLDAPSIDIPPVGTEGATSLSISVGLAHEDGLIDTAEMFEAATSAMLDARLEGGSRMLIAC